MCSWSVPLFLLRVLTERFIDYSINLPPNSHENERIKQSNLRSFLEAVKMEDSSPILNFLDISLTGRPIALPVRYALLLLVFDYSTYF